MPGLGRHGPKKLAATIFNVRSSREALLESVADGLTQVQIGYIARTGSTNWEPWKTIRETGSETLYLTSTTGRERSIPALRFTVRTSAIETQQGYQRTFRQNTIVSLNVLVGYTQPIDEYTIILDFTAHPGWMSRGAEMLVYETVVAVRNAVLTSLRINAPSLFHFVEGGWANLDLAPLGSSI